MPIIIFHVSIGVIIISASLYKTECSYYNYQLPYNNHFSPPGCVHCPVKDWVLASSLAIMYSQNQMQAKVEYSGTPLIRTPEMWPPLYYYTVEPL